MRKGAVDQEDLSPRMYLLFHPRSDESVAIRKAGASYLIELTTKKRYLIHLFMCLVNSF